MYVATTCKLEHLAVLQKLFAVPSLGNTGFGQERTEVIVFSFATHFAYVITGLDVSLFVALAAFPRFYTDGMRI